MREDADSVAALQKTFSKPVCTNSERSVDNVSLSILVLDRNADRRIGWTHHVPQSELEVASSRSKIEGSGAFDADDECCLRNGLRGDYSPQVRMG
jgi:hypothetical protein